jgi:type II secretory pathway component PulL
MVPCAYLGLTQVIAPVHIMIHGDWMLARSLGSQTADWYRAGFAAAALLVEVVMRWITQATRRRGPPGYTDIIGLASE